MMSEDRRVLEDKLRFLEHQIGRYEQAVQTEIAEKRSPFLYKQELERLKAERESILKKLRGESFSAMTALKTASDIGRTIMTFLQLKSMLLPGVVLGGWYLAIKLGGVSSVRKELVIALLFLAILVSYISMKKSKR